MPMIATTIISSISVKPFCSLIMKAAPSKVGKDPVRNLMQLRVMVSKQDASHCSRFFKHLYNHIVGLSLDADKITLSRSSGTHSVMNVTKFGVSIRQKKPARGVLFF